MAQRKKLGVYLVVLALGLLLGGLLGDLLGQFLPGGVARDLFVTSVEGSVGPATLDLAVLALTFGLDLRVNIMSLIGLVIAVYLLRSFL